MPPEGGSDVYSSEEETARLLADSSGGEDRGKKKATGKGKHVAPPWRRMPIKRAVQLLVFVDMLSVALVVPLLTAYFKDLNIRCAMLVGLFVVLFLVNCVFLLTPGAQCSRQHTQDSRHTDTRQQGNIHL